MYTFVETKLFARLIDEYLSDDEFAALQMYMIVNPEVGALIQGSGGVSKDALVGVWHRKKRRNQSDLLLEAETRANMAADSLCQERSRHDIRGCAAEN